MRVGRVTAVEDFPEARKPAWKLTIDFGPEIGVKRSSAQITNYEREALEGRLVVAVVNFPPRRIGPFVSEVLVLGALDDEKGVVLLRARRGRRARATGSPEGRGRLPRAAPGGARASAATPRSSCSGRRRRGGRPRGPGRAARAAARSGPRAARRRCRPRRRRSRGRSRTPRRAPGARAPRAPRSPRGPRRAPRTAPSSRRRPRRTGAPSSSVPGVRQRRTYSPTQSLSCLRSIGAGSD